MERLMSIQHIASIFKEYTTPSRVLRSFTNLSNTVIQTALSGQSKFVFEILQNADDAYEDPHQSIEVKFILQDGYLLVHHNGKGFDYNDVERICDYASQIEEVKATDLSKTGYKGLGFKSLFNLSDCIYIRSNSYSFRFDKGYWSDSDSKPWQVIPIWCNYHELPLNQKFPYDHPVNIVLKVNDVPHLESQLRELVDHPEMLLYMHRINKLSVILNGEKNFLERRKEQFGVFDKIGFYINQQVKSTWLLKTYKRCVDKEVQTCIRGASQFIYPGKVKNAEEVSITFAIQCDETLEEISEIAGLCYSTLPTQLHLTLPYHVNSLFILNLDRTQFHENEWNQFLIFQLGYLQFNLLKDLAEVKHLKNYVLQLFVRNINHPYANFGKAFLKGFMIAKEEIGWLPSQQGDRFLKLGEAWTDNIEFFKQNFQNIRNNKIYPFLIDYNVKGQNGLSFSKDGTRHFTYEQLFKDFPLKYYPQLTKGSYINFINYLYKRLNNSTFWCPTVRNLRFLKAKDGQLVSPNYALLEESENPIPDFLNLNTIDNEYLPLCNMDLIKTWLCVLGARRLTTPIQVLRESVLKWIESGNFRRRITIHNHIRVINLLFEGFRQFSNSEMEMLKEGLLILTVSNQFKPAKSCYFPVEISVTELSNIISDDEKISSSYDIQNLKDFFIRVGVTDKFEPIDVLRKSILTWIKNGETSVKFTKENYIPIIEFIAYHYPILKLQNKLTLSEIAEFKKMPILTSGAVFQKANVCYFDTAVSNAKWFDGVIARHLLVSSDVSDNVRKFLIEIGVSENIPPIDVIRNSVLKWIQEGDAEMKISLNNHNEILEYIGEHWNILNTGLTAKEKSDLKRMPIFTEGDVFKAADSCYWSISESNVILCQEIPGLTSVISPDEIVSSVYNLQVIKHMLEDLGVRNLQFTDIYEKYSDNLTHSKNVEWFFAQLVSYWNRNKSNNDPLLSCLQKKFRASRCLLAKNNKKYTSTELYSSRFDNIHDIDPDIILLLHYEKLPEDLEKFFGFQTDLNLKCIKQLLQAKGKIAELGKEKTLILFTTILQQLRNKDKNEIKKAQLNLLSEENKLKPARDLYYFIEENATCTLESCYLKRISGMSHDATLELAEFCGVNTMPFQRDITREEETLNNSLKEFYLERLSFIVLQESKKNNESVNSTLKRLYDNITAIKLYECCSLHVKYSFGNKIDHPFHFEGLTISVVGKWSKKKSKIHNYLKELLGIESDISDVLDMEQPTDQKEKEDWLSSQKEDPQKLSFVEDLLKKCMPSKENVFKPTKHRTDNRKKRRQLPHLSGSDYLAKESLHTVSSGPIPTISVISDTKWQTEKYVFTFLQDDFKKKYPDFQFHLYGGIFSSIDIEIIWINASGDKGQPYDLLIKEMGEVKQFIEVKSTNDENSNESFYINHRKFIEKIRLTAEFPDQKEKYCIYHVFNSNYSSTLNKAAAIYKIVLLENS